MLFFIIGWILISYVLSQGKNRYIKYISIIIAISVIYSVMKMKKYMNINQQPPLIYPAMFIIAWLIIPLIITKKRDIAYIGTFLILGSMMIALPWQRKLCIVDGPGMIMFTIGWILIIWTNSI